MAKRSRKGGKPVISQIWFRKDNVQLLAWLDHCVEHGDDFKKTVVSHLRSSRDYVYTWDQIYTKLDSIWRSKGEDVSKALMSDVFWKGTCSLPGLEEDLLKEVTVVKQKLKEDKQQEMRYRLRSTSTLQSIPATPSAKRQRKTTSPLSSPGSTPQPPSPSSSAHHPTNPSPAPSWEEQSDNTERTQVSIEAMRNNHPINKIAERAGKSKGHRAYEH